jgi:hypothetical protein
MASLYGRLRGNRGEVTRCGSKASGIHAILETWEGAIRVDLEAHGFFRVQIGQKDSPHTKILEGNINDRPQSFDLTQTELPRQPW